LTYEGRRKLRLTPYDAACEKMVKQESQALGTMVGTNQIVEKTRFGAGLMSENDVFAAERY
jgi:hypothetical protein